VRTNVSGQATTVEIAPARTSAVAIGSGQARTTVRTNVSGQATAVEIAPARASVVAVGGGVARTAVSAHGRAITSTVDAAGGRGATTVTGWDGATTRAQEGYANTTGDVPGRIAAIRQMARNAPPTAAAQGIGRLAFTEEDERVQRAAVDELARLRTRAADEQLRRIAREHPRSSVRARAAAALR